MKEKILDLRNQGKTYKEICEILGCSLGTVSYHCSPSQKEKSLNRQKILRDKNPSYKKLDNFKLKNRLKVKLYKFDKRSKEDSKESFTISDVIKKFGDNPTCYLTGKSIDWNEKNGYAFDHIIPVSRGGSNSLDNLGLCTINANKIKSDMLLEELMELCKDVLIHNGYTVIKK